MRNFIFFLGLAIAANFALGEYFAISNTSDAELLIIAPDRFVNTLKPLIDWKYKKGILTSVVPLSFIGNKPDDIKEFIRNFYYHCSQCTLKYVLLVGDIGDVAPYPHPRLGNTDASYCDIDGDTILDIAIGRLPARNTGQLITMINKIFNYERAPKLTDTMFYKKATTIRQDPGPYHNAGCNFVRNIILSNSDFVSVDTLVNPAHDKYHLKDSLKAGRSYVLYTGHGAGTNWVYPFDLAPYFNNTYKTPVIFSWCCRTVLGNNYLGQKWLRPGTVKRPRGAVAFIGTTTSGLYARYRNFVARNFFRAIFQYQILDISKALKHGLDSLWQYTPDSFGHVLYQEWNLIGDPTLQLWTKVPKRMICEHETIIENRTRYFEVRVKNSSGEPIPQALVCLSSPENRMFYFRGRTNCFGYIAFEINLYSVENFDITVTAPNYLPYESRCHVLELPALSTNHHSWKTLLKKPDIPPDSRFYLFDIQGRLICAGTKSIISDSFEALSPGIYYLYLKKSGFNSVKKLIITR